MEWLPQSKLNNTYALALNAAHHKRYGAETLSDVAELSRKDPSAVTLCAEAEFSARNDGLPGMTKAYGMDIPAGNIRKMSSGVVYTQVAEGRACAFGEVYTTDGRIKAMGLHVLKDDKHFFPNYNAAPEMNAATMRKYPQIADILAPVTKALDNAVAQSLNAKVDVEGQDPREVAKDWMIEKGFIEDGD